MMLRRWAAVLLLALLCHDAVAHKASDSYLRITVAGHAVEGQWDIALRDVEFAIGIDANGDGEITWGELRARHATIAAWALGGLELRRDGECSLEAHEQLVDDHSDGAYTVLRFGGVCPSDGGPLEVAYRLLFELDANHRGLLNLELAGQNHSAIFGPERPAQRFAAEGASRLAQLGQYLVEGVWHIWIGFDHILFLLALLLPAVLVRDRHRWQGVARFGDAAREVLWVVTAFTMAHSITLSLAALDLVALPSRLVESVIALSVALAAANNLWPVVSRRRWLVAFAFGLIHGFGFASVLADLGLPDGALLVSLLGFNLGVELGQLAVVAAFLPLAYALRWTPFYRWVIFVGGSLATLALALAWLVERALGQSFG